MPLDTLPVKQDLRTPALRLLPAPEFARDAAIAR
jgi:hypothetical protein